MTWREAAASSASAMRAPRTATQPTNQATEAVAEAVAKEVGGTLRAVRYAGTRTAQAPPR